MGDPKENLFSFRISSSSPKSGTRHTQPLGSGTGRSCTEQPSLGKSTEPHQAKPQNPRERGQDKAGNSREVQVVLLQGFEAIKCHEIVRLQEPPWLRLLALGGHRGVCSPTDSPEDPSREIPQALLKALGCRVRMRGTLSSVGLFSAFLSPSEAPGNGRRGHTSPGGASRGSPQPTWGCSESPIEPGTLFLQGKPTRVTPPNTAGGSLPVPWAQPPNPRPRAHHPPLCSPPASWPLTPRPSSQPRAGRQRDLSEDAELGGWGGVRGVLAPHRQEFGESLTQTLTFFLSSCPFLRSLLAMMTPVRSVSNTGSLLFAAGAGEL